MVIYEQTCKCGKRLRANGELDFEAAVLIHLRKDHKNEYEFLIIAKNRANEEFEELQEKYPELQFLFSQFHIDYKKALEK